MHNWEELEAAIDVADTLSVESEYDLDGESYAWEKDKEDTDWYPGADCPLVQTYNEEIFDRCPFINQDGATVGLDAVRTVDVLMWGTTEEKEQFFLEHPEMYNQFGDNKVYDEEQEKLLDQLLEDDYRRERKRKHERQ